MRIHTEIVFDIETGTLLKDDGYEYSGPLARCDRAAQGQANQAAAGDLSASQAYGTAASGIGSFLTPQLESWASGNAPGYGKAGVTAMENAAQSTAGASSDAAAQEAKLQALRSGNVAGLGAAQVGAAQAGGQNQTSAVQDILAQNAQLQAQEQMGAQSALGSLYGTNVGAQLQGLGQVPSAVNAQANAGQSGWYQNMLGGLNTGANVVKAYRGGK